MMDISIAITESGAAEDDVYSVSSLIKAVCQVFAVGKDDLVGKRRMAYIVTPRHVLYYLGYQNTSHSLPSLGRFLDKDHTTLIYGRDKIKLRIKKNKSFALKIEQTHLLAIAFEEKRQKNLEDIREEVADMVYKIQMEKLNGL
jgi:chromosomal replication initiation ATPase DnaA